MHRLTFLLLILCTSFHLSASEGEKSFSALRTDQKIVIDGRLDEIEWEKAPVATGFTTAEPVFGNASAQTTRVSILYDDQAIYIGAELFDTEAERILRQFSLRDNDDSNTDRFGFALDTYSDRRNAFVFIVSAAGIQTDYKITDEGDDYNWNAVWESAVFLNDEGWFIEIKIPYSAIRFPKVEEQEWRVNFWREIRRTREQSFWSPTDMNEASVVLQFGELKGIKNIEPPLRLSLMPYLAAYLEHYPFNQENKSNYSRAIRGGLDLKYGINESFTVDMTVIPDFGQVQSDNLVLNLSPYEVAYEEKRPFFTEGIELFQIGNLFYTRRVGGQPVHYDQVYETLPAGAVVVDNPGETQLINATKFSGRNNKGLGIGVFNGLSDRSIAVIEYPDGNEIEILTQPLTNYNVIVLNQSLLYNSSVSFVNTNTWRNGPFEDANVTGAFFDLRDKANKYSVSGSAVMSATNIGTPDEQGAVIGHKYNWRLSKISGRLRLNVSEWVESDKYDINDLGFLSSNNAFNHTIGASYSIIDPVTIIKPEWKLIRLNNSLSFNINHLYAPRVFTSFIANYNSFFLTPNYWGFGGNIQYQPGKAFDYFEPRVDGRYFVKPSLFSFGGFISTDYREKLAIDANLSHTFRSTWKNREWFLSIRPRIRVNDKLSFYPDLSMNFQKNNKGFADIWNDSIIFGNRNIRTISVAGAGSYIFNNKMGLKLNLRHYWSRALYNHYYHLQENGKLEFFLYPENADVNFNVFNIDLAYIWEFAPGSEVSLVWKNFILNSDQQRKGYFYNLGNTLGAPQSNSLSVKVLYYFDYLYVKDKVEPAVKNLF